MRTPSAPVLAVFSLLLVAPTARGQCEDWLAGPLDNGTAPNGANGDVLASIVWDPDGDGPQQPRLVVGGSFTEFEGVPASRIAARDPVTGTWEPLGSGMERTVLSLTVFNDQLVVGLTGDTDPEEVGGQSCCPAGGCERAVHSNRVPCGRRPGLLESLQWLRGGPCRVPELCHRRSPLRPQQTR